jgi:hypothetical protein
VGWRVGGGHSSSDRRARTDTQLHSKPGPQQRSMLSCARTVCKPFAAAPCHTMLCRAVCVLPALLQEASRWLCLSLVPSCCTWLKRQASCYSLESSATACMLNASSHTAAGDTLVAVVSMALMLSASCVCMFMRVHLCAGKLLPADPGAKWETCSWLVWALAGPGECSGGGQDRDACAGMCVSRAGTQRRVRQPLTPVLLCRPLLLCSARSDVWAVWPLHSVSCEKVD